MGQTMRSQFDLVKVGKDEALIGPTSTRQIIAALIAANGAPSVVADGFDCSSWVAILLKFVSTIGTSFDAKIWFWDDASGVWWLFTDFGTAGTKTVDTATNSGVYIANVPTFGQSRIYVQVLNFVGVDEVATVTGQASAV